MNFNRIASGTRILASAALGILLAACPSPNETVTGRDFPNSQREIYSVNALAETVSVLDPVTLDFHADAFPTGKWPNALVPFEGKLYIVDSGDNAIRVVRESDFGVLALIRLGKNRNPWTMVIDPVLRKGYVSNFLAGTVTVIDLETDTIITEIPVGKGPEGGCWMDGRVYFGNTNLDGSSFGEGTVSVIDSSTDAVVGTISIQADGWTAGMPGGNPQSMIAVPSRNEIHVVLTGAYGEAEGDDGEIVILDASDPDPANLVVKDRLTVGGSPVIGPDSLDGTTGRTWLAGVGGIMTYIIPAAGAPAGDPALAPAIEHGSDDLFYEGSKEAFFAGACLDPGSARLFVADFNGDRLLVLDPETGNIVKSIRASDGPQQPVLVIDN